mmetsp:Transcript_28775/g.73295  ORF Transcript_28775/g.73295 Transcript_28775/m.73295 type:complete len:223 (-) Transcript_28775:266-934(-)
MKSEPCCLLVPCAEAAANSQWPYPRNSTMWELRSFLSSAASLTMPATSMVERVSSGLSLLTATSAGRPPRSRITHSSTIANAPFPSTRMTLSDSRGISLLMCMSRSVRNCRATLPMTSTWRNARHHSFCALLRRRTRSSSASVVALSPASSVSLSKTVDSVLDLRMLLADVVTCSSSKCASVVVDARSKGVGIEVIENRRSPTNPLGGVLPAASPPPDASLL